MEIESALRIAATIGVIGTAAVFVMVFAIIRILPLSAKEGAAEAPAEIVQAGTPTK